MFLYASDIILNNSVQQDTPSLHRLHLQKVVDQRTHAFSLPLAVPNGPSANPSPPVESLSGVKTAPTPRSCGYGNHLSTYLYVNSDRITQNPVMTHTQVSPQAGGQTPPLETRSSLSRIAHTRGAIPDEMGPTRCRAKPLEAPMCLHTILISYR